MAGGVAATHDGHRSSTSPDTVSRVEASIAAMLDTIGDMKREINQTFPFNDSEASVPNDNGTQSQQDESDNSTKPGEELIPPEQEFNNTTFRDQRHRPVLDGSINLVVINREDITESLDEDDLRTYPGQERRVTRTSPGSWRVELYRQWVTGGKPVNITDAVYRDGQVHIYATFQTYAPCEEQPQVENRPGQQADIIIPSELRDRAWNLDDFRFHIKKTTGTPQSSCPATGYADMREE